MGKKNASKGAPRWMTTFADLSTLLLTFFVLMLSMANIDIEKFRELLGSLKDAFGVQYEVRGDYHATAGEETVLPASKNTTDWRQDVQKQWSGGFDTIKLDTDDQQEAVADIQRFINQSRMGETIEVQRGARGIRMRIKGALLFDPGQASLKPQALPLLDTLVDVLEKFGYYLLVEGHTDSIPIKTNCFPSNWELSGARASAVLRHLISMRVDSKRLTSVGLADSYPLTENTTEEGRARNRRVEFVLTKSAFRPDIN
jgi:chemotaxis protein MotB